MSNKNSELFATQHKLGKEIDSLYNSFKNATISAITQEYIDNTKSELNKLWKQFELNHDVLCNASDVDDKNEYFTSEYNEKVSECYAALNWVISITNPTAPNKADDDKPDDFHKPMDSRLRNQALLMLDLKKVMNDINDELDNPQDLEYYIAKKELIIQKWHFIGGLHQALMVEPNSYNVAEFLELEHRVQRTLASVQEKIPIKAEGSPIIVRANEQLRRHEATLRLPKITIPNFEGEYLQWKQFEELFQEVIAQQNMSSAQKMIYLKANVTGEAGRLIQHLQISEENYNTAWATLKGRYDNKRLIVSNLLDKIINCSPTQEDSAKSIKNLHDIIIESINALRNVNMNVDEWSVILHHIIIKKLDSKTHTLYEQNITNPREVQPVKQLLDFLELRFQALETIVKSKPSSKGGPQDRKATALMASDSKKDQCWVCQGDHGIQKCQKFHGMNASERFGEAKGKGRCINCLKGGHKSSQCPSKNCSKCNKKHNTLLHRDDSSAEADVKKSSLVSSSFIGSGKNGVFLGTAIVHLEDVHGFWVAVRAVLDSGSQISFISESCANIIGISKYQKSVLLEGIGKIALTACKSAIVNMKSSVSGYQTSLEVLILKNITSNKPSTEVDIRKWKIPRNIQLADQAFNIPNRVDLLVGAEVFLELLSVGQIKLGRKLPSIQNTLLGWVVMGKWQSNNQQSESSAQFSGIVESNLSDLVNTDLSDRVQQFWELEEVDKQSKCFTLHKLDCENFYINNTVRKSDGRFEVRLHFNQEPECLGSSFEMARRRFISLEKKLQKDPVLKREYIKFMQEYEELGHMSEISYDHHCVIKLQNSSTKYRVVFDASAKTSSNIALNEILINGPVLQQDLFAIVIRFRTHRYVFSADIGKMYRQISIDPRDRQWQKIIWRSDPSEEMKYYQLNTVTYGTTSASYTAIKTLQYLADLEPQYPLAGKVAKRDFNVDDIMTGSNDLVEAVKIQQELIELLKLGGMELHKWCANDNMLLESIPIEKQQIQLDINAEKTSTKALGLTWIPSSDEFKINTDWGEPCKRITKRTILSDTAKIFDPLGLVGPVVVIAKVFLDWDAALPMEIHSKWEKFRASLQQLNDISLPRHMIIENPIDIQLHAFADASDNAYGSPVYVRSMDNGGNVQVTLACSKSRVAPVKKISTPRLELCAAVLTSKLVKRLIADLNITISKIVYWSDSEVALSWIHSTSRPFQTFVANRISQIQAITEGSEWRYIPTKLNPADIISRGSTPEELKNSKLWFHGPPFLQLPESEWPNNMVNEVYDHSEEKTVKSILTVNTISAHFIDEVQHRNSFTYLVRVIAYMLRFIRNSKRSRVSIKEPAISVVEIQDAKMAVFKHIQQLWFADEIQQLATDGHINHRSPIRSLNPFLDDQGLIRVGGRLQNSSLSYDSIHPVLLPKTALTKLLIMHVHLENLHSGISTTLAVIRQRYWPIHGKALVRSVISQCVTCFRRRPKPASQLMGNLPEERINESRPFSFVGVDYSGSIKIHHQLRGKRPTKAYFCVFVCFAVKAVHIEVASDMTAKSFINCIKRFIARRGMPKKVWSDNAGNFSQVGNELQELHEILANDEFQHQLSNFCSGKGIEWSFIPARSPTFGGLWESCVKSAKYHLIPALAQATFTYEELTTLMTEIEAILNSRPLTPMSNDPNDFQALTPGHFLIGSPMSCINESRALGKGLRQAWMRMKEVKVSFWSRWSKEYLQQLQQRHKWDQGEGNLSVGTMVLMKEDDTPPMKWKLARVINVSPGDDQRVRVAEVKVAYAGSGEIVRVTELKRSIRNLCPLPLADEELNNSLKMINDINKETSSNPANDEVINRGNVAEHSPVKSVNQPRVDRNTNQSQAEKKTGRQTRKSKRLAYKMVKVNANSVSNLGLIMISLMFFLVLSAIANPYNITKISQDSGIYFEEIGRLSLSNDKWNSVNCLDLKRLWAEEEGIKNVTIRLNETCYVAHEAEYCFHAMAAFFHQVETMELKGDIIRSFRKTHVFRNKRGLVDGVGIVANELFGILSSKEASNYNQQFQELRRDNIKLLKILKNHTSIMDITKNVIKKDELLVQQQFAHLRSELWKFMAKDKNGKLHQFASSALYLNTIVAEHREVQNVILDILTSIHGGTLHPLIMTRDQLISQLSVIRGKISHSLMIPWDDHQVELSAILSLITVQAGVTDESLIIKIILPIVSREYFMLYHIVPAPTSEFLFIKPSAEYIAINSKHGRYYFLKRSEKDKCYARVPSSVICKQEHQLYNVQNGQIHCEAGILMRIGGNYSQCEILRMQRTAVWLQLEADNKVLYALPAETPATLICNDKPIHLSLNGSGILSMSSSCILKAGNIEISTHNTHESAIANYYVPNVNERLFTSDRVIQNVSLQGVSGKLANNDDMKNLEDRLDVQSKLESAVEVGFYHDVHHYVIIYTIVVMSIVVVVILCVKRHMRSRSKQSETEHSEQPTENVKPSSEAEPPAALVFELEGFKRGEYVKPS